MIFTKILINAQLKMMFTTWRQIFLKLVNFVSTLSLSLWFLANNYAERGTTKIVPKPLKWLFPPFSSQFGISKSLCSSIPGHRWSREGEVSYNLLLFTFHVPLTIQSGCAMSYCSWSFFYTINICHMKLTILWPDDVLMNFHIKKKQNRHVWK